MKIIKHGVWVLSIVLILVLSSSLDQHYQNKMSNLALNHVLSNDDFLKVTVLEVVDESLVDDGFGGEVIELILRVRVTSDPFKNDVLEFPIQVHDVETEIYPIEVNDKLLINTLLIEDEIYYSVVTYQREEGLLILIALFIGAVLLIGRFKGFRALLALAFSIHVILRMLIPAVLTSQSLIMPAFFMSMYILIGSFIMIGGFSLKTFHATLGSLIGLAASSGLAIFFLSLIHI